MLQSFKKEYKKSTFEIKPVEAGTKIDRTIETLSPELNAQLWSLAGYSTRPPTVAEMIAEMAAFDCCYKSN